MLNLASGFVYGGKVVWLTLSIAGELLKPEHTTEIDWSSRRVKVYTEEETGLPYAIIDRGEIRKAEFVYDPHALSLEGVPIRTTDPAVLSQMRREIALRAEPITTCLLVDPTNGQRYNGNGRPSHRKTPAVPVPAHD